MGRFRAGVGERMHDPESFAKTDSIFLSGEFLPRFWLDRDYRNGEIASRNIYKKLRTLD